MSKEAAAAILVQTLFTADKSMQNLVMSHAKVGTAKPEDVVKFILPYYKEMLKAMDSNESESDSEGTKKQDQEDAGHEQNERENHKEESEESLEENAKKASA
jgi:hypothetical protein